MPSNYLRSRLPSPRKEIFWNKLEKIWLEEGLKPKQLSERFGISYSAVYRYLIDKHGTIESPKKRYD